MVVALSAPVVTLTNEGFLRLIFGVRWREAHITGFPGDPKDGRWYGWRAGRRPGSLEQRPWNMYWTVSLFRDDPRTGASARRETLFLAQYAIMVDDVGTGPSAKVAPGPLLARVGPPTIQVETSPGNEQWVYVLDMPEPDAGRARALVNGMIASGLVTASPGKDPGMAGVCRYGRMPVSTNGKPAHGASGHPVRCTALRPRLRVTMEEMAEAWGIALPSPGAAPLVAPVTAMDAGVELADPVFQAMADLGHVHAAVPSRWGYHVTCPNVDGHTAEVDNGCAYRPGPAGRWVCHHGGCLGKGWPFFYAALDRQLAAAGLRRMAARELEEMPAELGAVIPGPRETFLREFVFLEPDNAFYSLRSQQLVPRASVNSVYSGPLSPETLRIGPRGSETNAPVDRWFQDQPEAQVVDGLAYWPGRGPVFEHGGMRLANRYRKPVMPLQAARVRSWDIRPWLDMVWHVMGVEGRRPVLAFLDWCAGVVAAPALKPAWMVCVAGAQGVGKDMVMVPVRAGVGADNVSQITGDQLASPYTGYAASRLVHIGELKQTTSGAANGHDQYNRIKYLVDNTQETIGVNPKMQKPYTARNVCAVFTSTNERSAMALELDDRRALVFMSAATRLAPAAYRFCAEWLALEGNALVTQWLHERWARMSLDRRGALSSPPLATKGKQTMVAAGGGVVGEWIAEAIASEDPATAWPDLMTAGDVMDRITRASETGREGLPKGTRIPGADAVGKLLAGLGAVRVAGGEPVRLPGGKRSRVWVTRGADRYVTLGGAAIAGLYQSDAQREFTGPEVLPFAAPGDKSPLVTPET